jgi:hypothetical protein
MRRAILSVVVVVMTAASAQADGLDAPLSRFRIPQTLPPCGITTAVAQLARAARVFIGFERTSDCMGASSFPVLDTTTDALDLSGISVREALDKMMALAPSYRWSEIDGVAVIRPIASWTDANAPLNFPVRAFTFNEGTVSQVVAKILRVPVPESPLDDQRFPLSFQGGTIADALNALVRAHGGALWDAGLLMHPSATGQDANPTLMVNLRTFSAGERRSGQGGLGVGTPVARLKTPQAAQ